jgi:hypothetical protein
VPRAGVRLDGQGVPAPRRSSQADQVIPWTLVARLLDCGGAEPAYPLDFGGHTNI